MCEKCRAREAAADFKLQLRISVKAEAFGARIHGKDLDGEIGGAVDILLMDKGTGVDVAFKSCDLAIVDELPPGYEKMAVTALRRMADALEQVEAEPELFDTMLCRPDGTPVHLN